MNNYLKKYTEIISVITDVLPHGGKILSIGSGPCDLEAILSNIGYQVTAVDDLEDPWYKIGENRERINKFAENMNINFFMESFESFSSNEKFDTVILIDIIEHLHTSPRILLNQAISLLRENGLLIVQTPNIAALKKRVNLLLGKNFQDRDLFYWTIGEYRAHIKEYTSSDLSWLLYNHHIFSIKIKMTNLGAENIIWNESSFLKRLIFQGYKIITEMIPNFRDTILVYGKKPKNWIPNEVSVNNYKKFYPHLEEYNLDKLDDEKMFLNIMEHEEP